MSAIFDEVTIDWRGNTYTVTPTYRMIQRIEQTVSIAGVSARLQEGNPPLSHVAEIVGVLLQNAGAKATADEVYEVMLTEMETEQIQDLTTLVMTAFIPRAKNSASPGKDSQPGGEETAETSQAET